MKSIEPGHANQAVGIRWRRRALRLRFAEDEPEIRADGGELFRAPEGDVNLQRIFQQEDTKQGCAAHHVEVSDRFVSLIKATGPLRDHLIARGGGLQTEGQVNIGPAVEAQRCCRTCMCRATEVGVILSGGDQFVAKLLSLIRSENGHGGIVRDRAGLG